MKSGIHDFTADQYHADPCPAPSLSSSIATILLNKSPRHAWCEHPRLNPNFEAVEDSKFDPGSAAHEVVLLGTSSVEVIDAEDWRTKAANEARDAARAAGKVPLLPHQWAAVEAMTAALCDQLAHHECAGVFLRDKGRSECTIAWQEDGGVWCRILVDWLPNDGKALYDYKTTGGSAEPDAWTKMHLYPRNALQAAFYRRGALAVGAIEPDAPFRFVIQENKPPFAMSVIQMTPAALNLAERQVDATINLWRECLTNDTWPGYPSRICHVDAPPWEAIRWEEREAREKFMRDMGEGILSYMIDWQAPIEEGGKK